MKKLDKDRIIALYKEFLEQEGKEFIDHLKEQFGKKKIKKARTKGDSLALTP